LIQTKGAHILGVQFVWTIAVPSCCALLGIAAEGAASKIIGHRRVQPIRRAAPAIAPLAVGK
jgi:hypothetical protein